MREPGPERPFYPVSRLSLLFHISEPLGVIRGRRHPLRTANTSRPKPLCVVSVSPEDKEDHPSATRLLVKLSVKISNATLAYNFDSRANHVRIHPLFGCSLG